MRKITSSKIDFLHLSILSASAITIIAVNYLLETPPLTIILYLVGTLFYIILINISYMDPDINSDYIQTGEAALGSFAVFIILRFVSDNPYIIFSMTFLCMILFEIYLKIILAPKKNDLLINGILVQIIIALIIYYLFMKDKGFNIKALEKTFLGYIHCFELNYIHISIIIIFFIILILLFSKLKAELKLFSHGELFFKTSGSGHSYINFLIIIIRSLLLTVTILLLGWLGGIGYYLLSIYRGKSSSIKSYLTIIILSQVLILLLRFTESYYVVSLSVAASYFIFLIFIKKRVNLYDRYQ